MTDIVSWSCQPFEDLRGPDVYDILQLRAAVFVVEQECAYLDPDGLDKEAWHWTLRKNGEVLATQRCLPPGTPYASESSIGRVVVAPTERGTQTGRELVRRAIDFNLKQWPGASILIGAQQYLERFYASLGFVVCSEPYLEDGIVHVMMRHATPATAAAK